MSVLDRRHFLGSSIGGLAALSFGPALVAQEQKKPKEKVAKAPPPVSQDPLASLFLTWQQDPTTTMTIQWVGTASAADIRVAPLGATDWRAGKTATKPFTNTDLIVHRCELTGLKPGTEYKFQIGTTGTDYRFRTMPAKATDTIQWVSGGDAGIDEHA